MIDKAFAQLLENVEVAHTTVNAGYLGALGLTATVAP